MAIKKSTKRRAAVRQKCDVRLISVPDNDGEDATFYLYDLTRHKTVFKGGRGEPGRTRVAKRLKKGGFR